MKKVAVVGSGFAAWGAVLALVRDPGISVHVFDIGLTSGTGPLADRIVPNAKACSGSYFCYGINDPGFPVRLDSERLCSSHAYGGHSRVYSGAILYPKDSDMAEWPSESRPRAEDYAAVLANLPVLGGRDEMESAFPLPPRQDDLSVDPQPAAARSVVGLSRLAVETADGLDARGEIRPFCVADDFRRFEAEGSLHYSANCYVTRVAAMNERVLVEFTMDGEPRTQSFDAVFLGAGCVNTTAIVDRSISDTGTREYAIRAPATAIHAFLRLPWPSGAAARLRQRHGLPEYFLEVRSPLTSNAWSHTQLTGINEQIIDAICARVPRLLHPVVRLARHVVYFALSGQKSTDEAVAAIRSTVHDDGTPQSVTIIEPPIRRYPNLVRAVRRAVLRHWRTLRMVPFPFGEELADYFRRNRLGGWHFGGTLPMRSSSDTVAECTPAGEVRGVPGLFVVDGSAFPSIPSSTVALLTAAHGHRVARGWRTQQHEKREEHAWRSAEVR